VSLLVAIETTSRVTGVALFDGDALVASVEREGLGDIVLPLVAELLASRGLRARDVARWAVDVGPGSFTGVRVGVSTVKGIAFATGAEVIAVDAFDALTRGEPAIAILDAGKGEVYYRVPGEAPGHAPLDAVRSAIEGRAERVVGPGVAPRAEHVGRVALARSPSDLDRLEPLYVRAPDLTRPKPHMSR
jgi:tRNA threonylcarbamoyladenosine biosynthesis protein TsaB